jgi:hypothetical protein
MAMLRLSPSDFAFLWQQCKRCFYLKVVHGLRPPSMPMAGIFKKLEGLQMGAYEGKRTTDLLPSLPPGTFCCGERVVESEPVAAGAHHWYVYGKTDTLLRFDDGTWGILDFKTTTIAPEKAATYGRQLHAYLHAFHQPAARPQAAREEIARLDGPVSRLGLLCFEPQELSLDRPGRQCYTGDVQWIEIPRDPAAFLAFVDEVMKLLAGPVPPPAPTCDWCAYSQTVRGTAFDGPGGPPPPAAGEPCPQCNAPMKQRTGKFGSFWGCTRYPACRGTREVAAK